MALALPGGYVDTGRRLSFSHAGTGQLRGISGMPDTTQPHRVGFNDVELYRDGASFSCPPPGVNDSQLAERWDVKIRTSKLNVGDPSTPYQVEHVEYT